MAVWGAIDALLDNWPQHLMVLFCTLTMFVIQRKRARRIFRYQKETVVVFTRIPRPGKAKTRLIPALGDNGAARAQLMMTDHIVNRLIDYQREHRDVNIDVHYHGGTEEQAHTWFGRRSDNCEGILSWHKQRGDHLGKRMRNAFMTHFAQNEDRAVIVGSDIPSITSEDIKEAMEFLRKEDDYDMVLGQAADGGYYLVGLNTNAIPHIEELFEGMEWGTDQVYKQQFTKAHRLGLRLHILKRKYNDVDRPEEITLMCQQLQISKEDLFYPQWSIIIPALNEGDTIMRTLDMITKRCSSGCKLEIIVVDGGSSDDTQQKVLTFAKLSDVKVTLAQSEKGRGTQNRAGARLAKGFYLMFLHADSEVPEKFDSRAEELLLTPGVSAGAFTFATDGVHNEEKRKQMSRFFIAKMRLVEACARMRCKIKENPYGDQGLFLTRKMYDKVGGFPAWPLLEDIHMTEKLRTQGHVKIAPGDPVICSSRRWEKHGVLKVTTINQSILTAYSWFGVSPERLARWYYGKPKTD